MALAVVRHRQRLHRAQRRAAGDREASSTPTSTTVQWVINGYALVFGVLIVTGGRLADMFGRRADLLHRRGDLRRLLAARRGRAELGVLIACRALMGIGGAMMWPAILGMTYAILPDEQGRARRRADPRRRRLRQRRRPAVRRRADRRAELALDLLPQPADRRVRGAGDVGGRSHQTTGRDRPTAGSTTPASRRSRSGSSRSCSRSTRAPTRLDATRTILGLFALGAVALVVVRLRRAPRRRARR